MAINFEGDDHRSVPLIVFSMCTSFSMLHKTFDKKKYAKFQISKQNNGFE